MTSKQLINVGYFFALLAIKIIDNPIPDGTLLGDLFRVAFYVLMLVSLQLFFAKMARAIAKNGVFLSFALNIAPEMLSPDEEEVSFW